MFEIHMQGTFLVKLIRRIIVIVAFSISHPGFSQDLVPPVSKSDIAPSDYYFYLNIDKQNSWKSEKTSIVKISEKNKTFVFQKGGNFEKKGPFINLLFPLSESEVDSVKLWIRKAKLPPTYNKDFRNSKERPVITIYFVSAMHEILVRWEGNKYPRNRIVQRLQKIKQKFAELLERKHLESKSVKQ